MAEQVTRAEWQRLASELLERYRAELARYGVALGPDLHLEADESTPYSYCDLTTGRISLNLPGTDRFGDLILMLAVGGLLGTNGKQETLRFLRAMLPYLLGHELAHYLRERHGAFASNRWVEEHAANRLGMALACTLPSFMGELPFLRRVAEGARERLPLREGEVVGALRETHADLLFEAQSFARLTGADELEALKAAGLEEAVAALSERREEVAAAFNRDYLTDATAYMRQQLAWFCAQVLEPEPCGLGAALEAHVLTSSWEERLAAESEAALARIAGEWQRPERSLEELLAMAGSADDYQRAVALEQLVEAGAAVQLRSLLERGADLCGEYALLEASAAAHGAPEPLREALADAHRLALEVAADVAGALAGVPLHLVRAGIGSPSHRTAELTLKLLRNRLEGEERTLAERLSLRAESTPIAEGEFRQRAVSDPDPLVATAAGAAGRMDRETLTELSVFRHAPLLRTLRGEELLPLAQAAEEVRAAPGTVLARKGERPERLFLSSDGRLFCLVETLAGVPLRRTLKMHGGGRMLAIEAARFLEICRGEPKLARVIAVHLARRGRGAPGGEGVVRPGQLFSRPLLPAEKALTLLETELFQGMSGQALLRVAEGFITRFYSPGEQVAETGGGQARLVVVVRGALEAGGRRLGAGAVLGDAECITGRPWREAVTAFGGAVTLEADRDEFLRLLYRLEGLPMQLVRRQARRLAGVV